MDTRELQKGFQRHESRAKDSTATRTLAKTTSKADLGAVGSIDNCWPGIGRTDRGLDILDNTLDDISDFTGSTVESTGHTDCTKPTDVRKRSMSNRKDLQYTTSLQLSALPATQPTSDSQETPQEALPSQTTMSATMFCIPMPLPGTLGSPMFEGANVTEFMERYKDLCSDYRVSEKDRLMRLPRYCIQPVAETIRSLNEWKTGNYTVLKKVLLSEYRDNDTH